jgi:hypothetical protein
MLLGIIDVEQDAAATVLPHFHFEDVNVEVAICKI